MEVVPLVGIRGAGKSTLRHQRYAATRLRLDPDTLRTRHRPRWITCAGAGRTTLAGDELVDRASRGR